MRPGRLDRVLYIGPPDLQGRIDILRIRTRKMSIEEGLDVHELARQVSIVVVLFVLSSFSLFHRPRVVPVRNCLRCARRPRCGP